MIISQLINFILQIAKYVVHKIVANYFSMALAKKVNKT